MTAEMTREQAAAAVAAATAERDSIQTNLLELDGSFGKRMLAGASLTGESKRRWEAAAADLATLWEIFTAYAAVVDTAAELAAARRPSDQQLEQITTMLNGPSVELTRPVPLARRELTETGRFRITLAAAVQDMERAFASVAGVVAAAETVWNETADRLSEIGTELDAAKEQAADLGEAEVTGALAAAGDELADLRALLNSDPLALWRGGGVDTTRPDRLRQRAAAAVARAGGLARQRQDAQRRGRRGRSGRRGRGYRFPGRGCGPGPGGREDRRRRPAATAGPTSGRGRGTGRAAGRAGQAQGRGTVGAAGRRAGHHRGGCGRGGAAVP
jgi:hypothetical protein